MTAAEAIEILRGVSSFFGRDSLPNTVPEAIDMAISALEKQEGKKPRTERIDYDKYGEYCVNYYCPCCNRRIVSLDSTGWFAGRPVRYCECGQRIERYADCFFAEVSMPEFVREAKMVFYKSMQGGVIDG